MTILAFRQWLEDELKRRGWSQADLARASGLNSGYLSRILNMERQVGPQTCRNIARAMGLPPETVFRRAGLLPPEVNSDAPERRELLYLFEQLPEDGREMLLALARTVVCERVPKYPPGTTESE